MCLPHSFIILGVFAKGCHQRDITKYRELVDRWGVANLKDSFELLNEIGNLFVVGLVTRSTGAI